MPPGPQLSYRLRQVPNAVRRAVRHPRWFAETVRGARIRRQERSRSFSLAEHGDRVVDLETALERVLGVDATAMAEYERGAWVPQDAQSEQPVDLTGRPDLIRLVRTVVIATRPGVYVETGVAQGLTTAVTLHAMDEIGAGHLHSVDLPVLAAGEEQYVGRLVPQALRDRWSLHLGPSRQMLPALLKDLGEIDVFLHDADHTYPSMLEEFRTAWPHLRPGGLLLSDDVANPSFLDFTREVGVEGYVIGDPADGDGLGIVRKP